MDAGSQRLVLERQLAREFLFWDRYLDLVVATHPDRDHLGSLVGVVERHPVGFALEQPMNLVLESDNCEEPFDSSKWSPPYAGWCRALKTEEIPAMPALPGQRIELGAGVSLEVIHPPWRPLLGTGSYVNNNAVVLRLTYRSISFLLSSDIEGGAEVYLVQEGAPLEATVLKVPHQGSATSSSAGFLEAVHPTVAVISVGQDNTCGHPVEAVFERLEEQVGKRLYHMDVNGTVRSTTDGECFQVKWEE